MSAQSAVSAEHYPAVLNALVENSFDSVMITEASEHTPIVYVNKAFTDLTGYPAGEVLGQSPNFLQGPETDAMVLARLREDLAEKRVFEGQTMNYRKDGSGFTMWWRVIPVMNGSNETVCFVAFQREADAS